MRGGKSERTREKSREPRPERSVRLCPVGQHRVRHDCALSMNRSIWLARSRPRVGRAAVREMGSVELEKPKVQDQIVPQAPAA